MSDAGEGSAGDGAPETGDGASEATRLRLLAVLVVALAGIAAVVLIAGGGGGKKGFPPGKAPARQETSLARSVGSAGCDYRRLEPEGRIANRSGPIDYRSDPPHSGYVHPDPVPVGAYAEAPVTEELVHSLLHGRVIIWFDPGLPAAERGSLKDLYDEDTYHLILTPRSTMDVPVAATAWGRRLTCPRLNRGAYDAIRAFRDAYRDRAPEFVP